MERISIGLDIGGSSIKAALVDRRGGILSFSKIGTLVRAGRDGVLDQAAATIADMAAKARESGLSPVAVGVGSPGFIDDGGMVLGGAPNLPDWRDFPLVGRLEKRCGLGVFASNDVNMAAYGECLAGSGRGARNMAFFSFGTGIGGGLVLDGKLYTGRDGMGAELGHICVEPRGLRCGCGRSGCLEAYASALGLAQFARFVCSRHAGATPFKDFVESGAGELSPETIFGFVGRGDPIAKDMFDRVCEYIARALGIIANALAPDLIVLGGGIMNSGELVLEEVRNRFPESCGDRVSGTCSIRLPLLGDRSGVIGAGLYAQDRSE
jgi:glucokinase